MHEKGSIVSPFENEPILTSAEGQGLSMKSKRNIGPIDICALARLADGRELTHWKGRKEG